MARLRRRPRNWRRHNGCDSVAVAEAWEWPDIFEGITIADLLRVQQAVHARCEAGEPPRYSDQAADGWAGEIIAGVLGLNAMSDRKRLKRLIEEWLKSGALVKGVAPGPIRKPVPTVGVGEWATE